ncbi:DNA polymerase-like protein [Ralstonia phage phiITL-1]|uniref:DNA polymerase-like protein n=1 Tax=Ralstonia phage phiITL-1 TaxID=1597967 RepID=A0A0U1ZAH8_9CAUD|nr:DNA polymerase I [Ralstonia phage phiITL-1]AJT60827.1 DNA polymerase-like protein [Ralstonia phage phiITL-1]
MIQEKFPKVRLFDIETDGLMEYSVIPGVTESAVVSKVHCIVIHDYHAHWYRRYRSDVPGDIERGLEVLMESDLLVAHNGIKYDIPVLELLYPHFKIDRKKVLDTLVLSRLLHANIKDTDNALLRRGELPGKLYGSHSLKAWGYRVGEAKGSYGEGEGDVWAEFNEEMLEYCEQDVVVTRKVFDRLMSNAYYFSEDLSYTQYAVRLEHDAAWVLAQQERNGFPFFEKGAAALYAELSGKRNDILQRVMDTFGSWYVAKGGKEAFRHPRTNAKLLKYPNVTYPKTGDIYTKSGKLAKIDYCKDRPYTPVEHVVFNPGSRQHIAKVLQERGWVPEEFTETGQPKVDEETLAEAAERLPEEYREDVKLIAEYLLLIKRLGQIAEGDNAWLKLCNRGFIHGSVNPNGAVTGRATHAFPNIAQVPSGTALYGPQCRALFGVAYVRHVPGWEKAVQVGTDASGLELRCLGHFMAKFDGGQYIKDLLEGDIHWVNVESLGFVPKGTKRIKEGPGHEEHDKFRGYAKTFIYAFLYGAGDEKIGSIIPGGDKAVGKDLKKKFMEGTPAIAELRAMLEELLVESQRWADGVAQVKWKRRWIKGLDGRKVHVRSPHAALNTLLQSAGALICKYWIVETERILVEEMGLVHGWHGDFAYLAWVHDEMQIAARTPEVAQKVAEASQAAMRRAGDFFKFRCLLDTESKVGDHWGDCH